jgi:glycosyltransferase involved in cell wall biosynthesis
VLVIDDGSTDSTASILKRESVEVLSHSTCLGSMVILSGLKAGLALDYKYVIKIDGDDQHDPRDIARLYSNAIQTKADMVMGSRHLKQFTGKILSIHGIGMWFCSKLVSLLIGKRITDATSGYKLWNKKASEVIIHSFNSGKLVNDSTISIEELLIVAWKGLKISEIDVVMYPRLYGESKSFNRKKLFMFPFNLVRSIIRARL